MKGINIPTNSGFISVKKINYSLQMTIDGGTIDGHFLFKMLIHSD